MASVAMRDSEVECWIVRPRALPRSNMTGRLLWAAVFISGSIGVAFSLAGAWPVLPFAGIEIIALWLALRHVARHGDDFEKIGRQGDRLLIERRSGRRRECHEFHSYWARLRVEKPPDGADSRLFIGSHGREIEIGRRLTGEQKKTLAIALKKQLGV